MTPNENPRATGEYRRRDGVRLSGKVLVSTRPLSASRLNDAGVDTVSALEDGDFQSPETVARETNHDDEAVRLLLERLHRRGFLEWRPRRDPAFRPPVSVVITVRDDRHHLQGCLDAIRALEYPEYEVVVVDDGSSDGTVDAILDHPLADEGLVRIASVGSPDDPLGIGASRNRGVEAATHNVIAFTDADCRPREDWLSDLVPCLAEHDLVGGRIRPAGDGWASAYEAVNSSLDNGPYGARVDPGGDTPYLATANLVSRREVFESVQFPDRDVAEDVELCWRALDAGWSVVYSPRGVVDHSYRSGILSFAARRSDYGASEALLARIHGRDDTADVSVPVTVVVAVVLVFLGISLSGVASAVAFAGVVCVASLALGTGALRLWRRSRTLPPDVSAETVIHSWLRQRLSSTYTFSSELVRYYAIPVTLLGFLVAAVGLAGLGAAILVGVLVAVLVPLIVEYAVDEPDVSIPGYAAYYFADHLGYQHGVYKGIIVYRTFEHVCPTRRFRLIAHETASFGCILAHS